VIDWSQCPDVESVPDRCGGEWVVKGSRVMVECIIDNSPECTPEEIAHELYDLDLDAVRRILAYAETHAPETIYFQPICPRCKDCYDAGLWWPEESRAVCPYTDCTKKPVAYIRADLYERKMDEIGQRAAEAEDELYSRILMLQSQIDRLRAEIDTPRERRGFS
jgi:uncharacterized protein (DUF433 family)